jgi:hypothetical protein
LISAAAHDGARETARKPTRRRSHVLEKPPRRLMVSACVFCELGMFVAAMLKLVDFWAGGCCRI